MLRKLPNLLAFSIIILSFFFLRIPTAWAEILFQDNFDDGEASGWIIPRNQCSEGGNQAEWKVENGKYGISINGPSCVTETIPENWNDSWNDYIFETDVAFETGTDGNIAFRYSGNPNFDWYGYHFQISSNPSSSKITLQRVLNTDLYTSVINFPLQHYINYHLKIVVNKEHIQLFINDSLVLDYPDAGGRFTTGKIALQASVGADQICKVWFNNVVVRSIDELEEETVPIVLLPGLGGSWDTTAMFTGGLGDDWQKTPFVKVYDNFKNTLVNNGGYVLNQNYFEFYYDWRKPLDTLADEFKTYLETVVLAGKPEGTKVNLVGHSMGGLLATAYSHKYGLDKVNKIVTVGSPHAGAIPAWSVWSGGEMIERWSWGWLALEIYLQLQKGAYSSPVDVARHLAPSVNDLLPTFDFAKNQDGQTIPVASMASVNLYLSNLEANLTADLKNILATLAGKDDDANNDTVRWVKLKSRTLTDRLLGKWADGKPENFEYSPDGDLTVLQSSALVTGATVSAVIDATHVNLLENQAGIQAVLNVLGLSGVEPVTNVLIPSRNPALVFMFRSPEQTSAQFQVDAPDGFAAGASLANPSSKVFYSGKDKLLIIFDAQDGNYRVKIIGTEAGEYELEVGQLTKTENVWTPLDGQTTADETDIVKINFNSANPQEQPIVDATGKTQVEMTALVFTQIASQVNQISIAAIYKQPVLDYLTEIDSLTTKALNKINAKNYLVAKDYAKSIMLGAYNLRQKIDVMAEQPEVTDVIHSDLKNQANQAGNLMIDAYANIFTKSGLTLSLGDVSDHIKISQEKNKAAADKLKTISGENQFAGDAYSLSSQFLTQALEDKKAGQLPFAWAKSVVSRLLSLEATKLID